MKEKEDKILATIDLIKLVRETPAEEIHHLIEWLLEDDEEEDPVI
jgi:hypothetical protein